MAHSLTIAHRRGHNVRRIGRVFGTGDTECLIEEVIAADASLYEIAWPTLDVSAMTMLFTMATQDMELRWTEVRHVGPTLVYLTLKQNEPVAWWDGWDQDGFPKPFQGEVTGNLFVTNQSSPARAGTLRFFAQMDP